MLNTYLNYLQESLIFSEKTMAYELDSFYSNKYKKLLIMGLPGAGKTTFAHKLEREYKIPVLHTDDAVTLAVEKILGKDISKATKKAVKEKMKEMGPDGRKFWDYCYRAYIKPTLLSDKRYIIEGCIFQWYHLFPSSRPLIIKFPSIVLGKSWLKSQFDRSVRDDTSLVKLLFKDFKNPKLYKMMKKYVADKKKVSTQIEEFDERDFFVKLKE